MIQYIKLQDNNNIALPLELTNTEDNAISMFGKSKYISQDLSTDDNLSVFASELVDGQIVICPDKLKKADIIKAENEKKIARNEAIKRIKKNVDATKKIDDWSTLERKIVLGIGEITNEELGIS